MSIHVNVKTHVEVLTHVDIETHADVSNNVDIEGHAEVFDHTVLPKDDTIEGFPRVPIGLDNADRVLFSCCLSIMVGINILV